MGGGGRQSPKNDRGGKLKGNRDEIIQSRRLTDLIGGTLVTESEGRIEEIELVERIPVCFCLETKDHQGVGYSELGTAPNKTRKRTTEPH